MKFRIIASFLLLAVLAGIVIVSEQSTSSTQTTVQQDQGLKLN